MDYYTVNILRCLSFISGLYCYSLYLAYPHYGRDFSIAPVDILVGFASVLASYYASLNSALNIWTGKMFRQLALALDLALTLSGHYAAHIVVSLDHCPLPLFTHRFALVLKIYLSFSVLARRVFKLS